MICPKCNAYVAPEMAFCSNCGEMITANYNEVVAENEQPVYNAEPQYNQDQYNQPQYNQDQYNQPQYNQPQYNQPQYNQPQYNQPQYNQPQYNQPQYNQPSYRPDPAERIPTKGEYFVWRFILPLANIIPLLYPILVIVFACDKNYPAKANFFKSTIVLWCICLGLIALGIVVSILLSLIFTGSLVGLAGGFEDIMYAVEDILGF